MGKAIRVFARIGDLWGAYNFLRFVGSVMVGAFISAWAWLSKQPGYVVVLFGLAGMALTLVIINYAPCAINALKKIFRMPQDLSASSFPALSNQSRSVSIGTGQGSTNILNSTLTFSLGDSLAHTTKRMPVQQMIPQEWRVTTPTSNTPRRFASPEWEPASIDFVYPGLRSAHLLQGYAGATPSSPNRLIDREMELDYEQYQKEFKAEDTYFNFCVCNANAVTTIHDVHFWVTLPDGVPVLPLKNDTRWEPIEHNQYRFRFQNVPAQEGANGDDVFRLDFPKRGTYTFQFQIGAEGLGQKAHSLVVTVK